MPMVTPTEPFARPPKVVAPRRVSDWDGEVDVIGNVATIEGARITGPFPPHALPADDNATLSLTDCELTGVSLVEHQNLTLDLTRCVLTTCDLSRLTVSSLNSVSFTDCKLIGTNLADGEFSDITVTAGIARYLGIRIAALTRASFADLVLTEADLYDAKLTDVTVHGCTLEDVSVDRCLFTRVDLRGARQLGMTINGSLAGALISEPQVFDLAYQFALSSGVSIEQRTTSSPDSPQ